jgi:hypothetical protein
MIIDIEWFGYGSGLVLVGWVAGMSVGAVLRALKII